MMILLLHAANADALLTNPRPRILIVEDDHQTLRYFAEILDLHGYQVTTALGAVLGLAEMTTSPPDAVIVDLRMPGVDGLEFLRRLRARPGTQTTPVAVVTGDYMISDAETEEIASLGASVRFKPFWLETLTELVRELLDGNPSTQR